MDYRLVEQPANLDLPAHSKWTPSTIEWFTCWACHDSSIPREKRDSRCFEPSRSISNMFRTYKKLAWHYFCP